MIALKEIDAKLRRMIEEHGFAIMTVLPDEVTPSYGYTIGLDKNFGNPEICMVGFHPDLIRQTLLDAGKLVTAGQRMEHGAMPNNILDVPLAIRRPSDEVLIASPRFAFALEWYAGEPFRMVQMFLPDENGMFPWDAACHPQYLELQYALLGAPAEFQSAPGLGGKLH